MDPVLDQARVRARGRAHRDRACRRGLHATLATAAGATSALVAAQNGHAGKAVTPSSPIRRDPRKNPVMPRARGGTRTPTGWYWNLKTEKTNQYRASTRFARDPEALFLVHARTFWVTGRLTGCAGGAAPSASCAP